MLPRRTVTPLAFDGAEFLGGGGGGGGSGLTTIHKLGCPFGRTSLPTDTVRGRCATLNLAGRIKEARTRQANTSSNAALAQSVSGGNRS